MAQRKSKDMLPLTPETKKKIIQNTPTSLTKVGGKRPRQDDINDELLHSSSNNNKLKKMKRNIAEDDSEEDVSVDSDEDGDESADEEVSDDDDDEEEDGDEEDDEEEEDEDDDEESDIKGQIISNKSKTSPNLETSKASHPKPGKSSNLVIFNFDHLNRGDLVRFLSKRGVKTASVNVIKTPVALVNVKNDEDARLVQSCTGVHYRTKKLAALNLIGDVFAIAVSDRLNPNMKCVFAFELPKTLTDVHIKKMIGFEPEKIKMITSGPKNEKCNACYIHCSTHEDACKALDALSDREESGFYIKAMLREEHTSLPPLSEKSLLLHNMPYKFGPEDIRKEFPTSTSIQMSKKGSFLLTFKSKEDRDKVAAAKKGKDVGGRPAYITTDTDKDYAITVFNIPFTAKSQEIKDLYPGCKNATIRKKADGRPNGSALVFFETEEAAKQAVAATASKKLQARQLKAVLKGEEGEKSEVKKVDDSVKKAYTEKKIVKTEKPIKKVKPPVKPESDDDDESESSEKEDDGAVVDVDSEDAASDDEEDDDNAEEAASDKDEEESDENDDEDEEEEEEEGSDEEMPEVKAKPAFKKEFTPRGNGQNNTFRGNFRGKQDNRGGNFRGSGGNNFRGGRGNNFRRPAGRFQRGGRGGRGGGFKPQWRGSQ